MIFPRKNDPNDSHARNCTTELCPGRLKNEARECVRLHKTCGEKREETHVSLCVELAGRYRKPRKRNKKM